MSLLTARELIALPGLQGSDGLRVATALIDPPITGTATSMRELLALGQQVIGALIATTSFERLGIQGLWPKLSKDRLVADLRATIRQPLKVNQQATALCGPAAIAFELVSNRPSEFVRACWELYEHGHFRTRGGEVKAGKALRASGTLISPADWIFCASLRDDENLLFDVDETSGSLALGLTMPGEMKGWASEMLGHDKTRIDKTFVKGELDAIRDAEACFLAGGAAFLMISAKLLTDPIGTGHPRIPDHWVVYRGQLAITGGDAGRVTFKCYSWGKIITVDVSEERFEHCMFGVVTSQ